MDMSQRLFNFTYASYKDPNDDWGLGPKSGPFNLSGTWGGVMGGVINGEYDLSLSAWYWIFARCELLSFAPVIRSRYSIEDQLIIQLLMDHNCSNCRFVLAVTPQVPEVDYMLYLRPFHNEAWLAILGMLILLFGSLLVIWTMKTNAKSTTGFRVIN